MEAGVPTSAGLLARARSRREAADRAEAELLETTLAWAALHPDGVVVDPYGPEDTVLSGAGCDPRRGADQPLELAGPGAPTVSELAVVEYAAVLGMSTDAGRRYVGDALEIGHRLPRLHARVTAGDLPVWRARRIAQATKHLSPAAADHVDARIAPIAHRVGLVVLDRLVEEARARCDPEEAELAALEAAEARHATIHRPTPGHELAGQADLTATLDLPDALDLDSTLSRLAQALKDHGSQDSLDVRRARALGLLARGETLQPPDTSDTHPGQTGRTGQTGQTGRAVTLYVHTTAETLHGPALAACTCGAAPATGATPVGGLHLARLENTRGLITADTLRDWLNHPGTQITLKPVIDLRDQIAVDAYEAPDRIAEHVRLERSTCAFPHCTRPARSADLDHTEEYLPPDQGGPPGQTGTRSLAPLCRRHHRAKTHPTPTDHPHGRRWRYHRDPHDPATFIWTSPHGHRYRVDPTGTTSLTPRQHNPPVSQPAPAP